MHARSRISLILALMLLASLVGTAALPVGAAPASKDIRALYSGAEAMDNIASLVALGPRVAGSAEEKEAAALIAGEFEEYGLTVDIEQFDIIHFEDRGSTLSVVNGPTLDPITMQFSPPGDVTARLVDCGMGNSMAEFPPSVSGNIALIKRGVETFYDKTQNAAAAGATAAIIYNREPGALNGTLGSETDIPSVGISQEEGEQLLSLMATGDVTVHLTVDTEQYPATSQNVIATRKGTDPNGGIVYIGGHYDSVGEGPGANDDASGVGALMESARVLGMAGHQSKATLKFIAFGAEETGLEGSLAYVVAHEEEVATKGLGMVNLDMIGVGDVLQIGRIEYPDGSTNVPRTLVDFAGAKAVAMGLQWEYFAADENSDHTYFEYVGVPTAFITQDPDPNYHTAEDTLDKIDPVVLEHNGELATATMLDWGKNPVLRERKAAKIKKANVYREQVMSAE